MALHESIFRLDDVDQGPIPIEGIDQSGNTESAKGGQKKRVATDDIAPALKKRRAEIATKRAATLKERKDQDLKIIHVGVDFGTTYSGISFITGHESAKGDAEVITNWRHGNGILEKVPTRIAYASENSCIKDRRDRFGYEVSSKMKSYWWFKLGLDQVAEPSDFDDPLIHAAVGRDLMKCAKNKTYQEMTADFLRFLYKHTLTIISGKIGKEALTLTSIVFHVTLPATWSPKARDSTRTAAVEAGFGSRPQDKVMLTDEPEAATICAIKTNLASFQERSIIKKRACITIADLGGGTCDLISYKVVKTSPLQLEEACVGSGAKCGGTTIDRSLHKLMEERFDKAFTMLEDRLKGPGSAFMERFEDVKRNFSLDEADETFELPLKMPKLDPETKGYDFDDDMVQITREELGSMFDDVVRPTLELANKQIEGVKDAKMGAVKAIILCGGLGSSPYVEKCFAEYAKTDFKTNVEIISPNRPWSAIARGAALSGLDKPVVLYRRSRNFIGISVNHIFDESMHTEDEAFINDVTGKKQAADQMEWLIHRGDPIRPRTKESVTCFADIPVKGSGKLVQTQYLYCCTADKAPQRLSDPEVQRIGKMSVNLTKAAADIRKKARAQKSDKSKSAKALEIKVEYVITPHTDKGILQVVAMDGKKVIGEATIEYEADPTWECRQAQMAKK